MAATALVVGGTGPTGPLVVQGLRERRYEVTLLHRGVHELPELADIEHLHADPHFAEPMTDAVGGRSFDVVVAMYGRLRHVAAVFSGRCNLFVAVSGIPVYAGYLEPETTWPAGMPVLAREDAATVTAGFEDPSAAARFAGQIAAAERKVLDLHHRRAFSAAIFRFPSIYGPRQLYPREWSVIRRILDDRPFILIPDGGLTIQTRCAAVNASGFLLAAVDRQQAAAGQIFNVADVHQFSYRQWIQLIAAIMRRRIEVASMPYEMAGPARDLFPLPHSQHNLLSIAKAQSLLSYTEAVPAADALTETVRWYLHNPPGGEVESVMKDKFDYVGEDRLLAGYRAATAPLLAGQAAPQHAVHPYPHPHQPGNRADDRGR